MIHLLYQFHPLTLSNESVVIFAFKKQENKRGLLFVARLLSGKNTHTDNIRSNSFSSVFSQVLIGVHAPGKRVKQTREAGGTRRGLPLWWVMIGGRCPFTIHVPSASADKWLVSQWHRGKGGMEEGGCTAKLKILILNSCCRNSSTDLAQLPKLDYCWTDMASCQQCQY